MHGNIPVRIKVKEHGRLPLDRHRTGRHYEGAARRRFEVDPVQRPLGEARRKRRNSVNRRPLPVPPRGPIPHGAGETPALTTGKDRCALAPSNPVDGAYHLN